jgi:hypothetical protein
MAASWPPRTIGGGLEKEDDREAAFCGAQKCSQDDGMARTSNDFGCGARTSDRDGDGEGEGRASKGDAPYRVAAAPFSQEIE